MGDVFADFGGAALTVRFKDGGHEVETATAASTDTGTVGMGDAGDDAIVTLPETTALALGVGLEEGWFDDLGAYADGILGEGGLEQFLEVAEAETGIDLPADLETVLGESTAMALDGSVDLTAFEQSEPPSDVRAGVKVKGDSEAIADILDTLRDSAGDDSLAQLLGHDEDGDFVAVGPSDDYRSSLLEDGGLGDTSAYRDAVLSSEEAGVVFFVHFDAGDWLTSLPDLPAEVQANLAPLRALGVSAWADDGVGHTAVRITTG